MPRFVEATADEWAEFCIQFDYHNTEGRMEAGDADYPLITVDNVTGNAVGKVRYHDNVHRTYYINKEMQPPKQPNVSA